MNQLVTSNTYDASTSDGMPLDYLSGAHRKTGRPSERTTWLVHFESDGGTTLLVTLLAVLGRLLGGLGIRQLQVCR